MRGSKAASAKAPSPLALPGRFKVRAARDELNQVTGLIVEVLLIFYFALIYGNHRLEIARPFRLREIFVVARRHNVNALQVGAVDPGLILVNMIGDTATEATIQDMVIPLNGEIHALADDLGPRDVVGA